MIGGAQGEIPMGTRWRNVVRRFHPEGIPWPLSRLYNGLSQNGIFQQHYALVAEDAAKHSQPLRVLDIGTGPGWLLPALATQFPNAEIVGVDVSEAMVAQAVKNLARVKAGPRLSAKLADARQLPFPDASFDLVVSTGSMHHWKDAPTGLNEIHRVLSPEGTALIYDLVKKLPADIARNMQREFGRMRTTLIWLHSFEEPFVTREEMEELAATTRFRAGKTHFVGGLCCLTLCKENRSHQG
jgi:ubiquinone/menaquinone biosynthesis C-methylase UbiE